MKTDLDQRLREAIRDVPDFPKPGILFRDVTTLLLYPGLVREALDGLWERFSDVGVTHVVAIEARGFIVGAGISLLRNLPLVLLRKPGKLPSARHSESYDLEYGSAALEVHSDALRAGDRALVVDDVLATGGTAAAAGRLIQRCGGLVVGFGFLAELDFLSGRQRLVDAPVFSLLHYD